MVLPPYVYTSDWFEMKAHITAVLRATKLGCMLYNNPVAYKTDFLPDQIAELAGEHQNLKAVKESSTDVRRGESLFALFLTTSSASLSVWMMSLWKRSAAVRWAGLRAW